MKKPINHEELENDMNKILSFIGNLENLDIESIDQIDKLKKQAESFDQILKTKYKDYLDDQE
jgi:Asp-tRNA(Asn)/Glu-tRNA(Gln) amidotransferase C subunit